MNSIKFIVRSFLSVQEKLFITISKKGITLGEFEIDEIKQEKGLYSWGGIVEKKYYKNGPNAKPTSDPRIKEYFDTKKP